MKKVIAAFLSLVLVLSITACGQPGAEPQGNVPDAHPESSGNQTTDANAADIREDAGQESGQMPGTDAKDSFICVTGGTFQMGSPDTESWRSDDETQHTVTVSDFYMAPYEVTQAEYEAVMGRNSSNFTGSRLPVENISWLEAEWEYACRAGTATPFYMENSPSAEEANYYGHYPYEIEGNYFSQENLTTKPGEYRQTTVEVDSFSPNPWGLYNMHGNVGEWTWDIYGAYPDGEQTDPTGAQSGTRRVYRGGGWNDFAKNMRCAYRATMDQDKGSFNIGIRLVRNAAPGSGNVAGTDVQQRESGAGSGILIAYFSWGGNTRGIAEEIQSQTGTDLFEITLVNPYSSDYNTVLDEAQWDQNEQARPKLASHVENMDDYDTIILGYPNWWASIPMPIASFLEEYDFSGKTIIPFCSHGGGRFGQSLTAIAKLAPDAQMGEGLSVHYSGGNSLPGDVAEWLEENGIGESND